MSWDLGRWCWEAAVLVVAQTEWAWWDGSGWSRGRRGGGIAKMGGWVGGVRGMGCGWVRWYGRHGTWEATWVGGSRHLTASGGRARRRGVLVDRPQRRKPWSAWRHLSNWHCGRYQ